MQLSKKNMQIILLVILVVAGGAILTQLTRKDDFTDEMNKGQDAGINANSAESDNVEMATEKELFIDQEKCVGCGRCVRLAPDNFAMDNVQKKAKVISQKNLESESVRQAIAGCPKDAIALITK
jgi:ferredoxin